MAEKWRQATHYLILYKYGGIYADMDYMCFKNFYNILPKNKISISESPYKENEEIQNALMISPPNNSFCVGNSYIYTCIDNFSILSL